VGYGVADGRTDGKGVGDGVDRGVAVGSGGIRSHAVKSSRPNPIRSTRRHVFIAEEV
jgi:hypothetical protein